MPGGYISEGGGNKSERKVVSYLERESAVLSNMLLTGQSLKSSGEYCLCLKDHREEGVSIEEERWRTRNGRLDTQGCECNVVFGGT